MTNKKKTVKKSKKTPIKRVDQKSPAAEVAEAVAPEPPEEPPPAPPPPTEVDPRTKAREERRRLKAEQLKAREVEQGQQATPAAIERPKPAPVTDIDKARTRKAAKDASARREPIHLELSELHRWKLDALQQRYNGIAASIRGPIVESANRAVAQKVGEILKKHPEAMKAEAAMTECTNEIITEAMEELPEGYAVKGVELSKGRVTAAYDPDAAGKTLVTPESTPEE